MTSRAVPVSAPGKLFVLGEYAVLGGGPALLTSVDRHVHVRPRPDADGYSVEGAHVEDPLHLPLLIRELLREEEGVDVDPNRLTVDVGEFYRDDTKLGIGSSAASTTAVIASVAPQLPEQRRFELALEAHRQFQGGVGSGADIAVSTFGGPLIYRLRARSEPFDQLDLPGPDATDEVLELGAATIDRSVSFPDDLRIDAVWTGHRAHSTSFVDAVATHLRDNPREATAQLAAVARSATAGLEALNRDDADAFVDAVRDGDRAMEQLGGAAGVPIITDTHRRIRALAHTTHAVAKPSGAGGGDFTLLVAPADAPIPRPVADDYFTLRVH